MCDDPELWRDVVCTILALGLVAPVVVALCLALVQAQ